MATDDEGQTPDAQSADPSAKDALSQTGVVDTLKRSLAEYIEDNHIQPKSGEEQLNLDWDFVRDHGGPLAVFMFQKLTRAIIPENVKFSVPASKPDENAPGTPPVNVKLDLGDFLGKLFQPATAPKGDDKK